MNYIDHGNEFSKLMNGSKNITQFLNACLDPDKIVEY